VVRPFAALEGKIAWGGYTFARTHVRRSVHAPPRPYGVGREESVQMRGRCKDGFCRARRSDVSYSSPRVRWAASW